MSFALLSNIGLLSLAVKCSTLSRAEVVHPHGRPWREELADDTSTLYGRDVGTVFLLLHGPSLLPPSALSSPDGARPTILDAADAVSAAAARHPETRFVVSTLDLPVRAVRPVVSHGVEPEAAWLWRREMEHRSLALLDLAEIAASIGRRAFYNGRTWYMGEIPFSKTGEAAIAAEIYRIWKALRGVRRKCLALDLDNTLWGGSVGELGIEGLHLSASGSGSRFRDFQRCILELRESGVLLAAISRTNRKDALAALDRHPDMLLRSRDFAAIRANWEPKWKNLRSVAEELGLEPGDFVFVDDHPVERETMQIALPDVAVPQFPEDTSQLERFMLEVGREYFLAFDADAPRDLPHAPSRPKRQSAYDNIGDYLSSLGMTLSISKLGKEIARFPEERFRRGNRIDLAGGGCGKIASPTAENAPGPVYLGSLRDRFGSYGAVLFCAARVDAAAESAYLDTLLLNIDAADRGLERAFLRALEDAWRERGIRRVVATTEGTPQNREAQRFWTDMGYESVCGPDGTAVGYARDLSAGREGMDLDHIEILLEE